MALSRRSIVASITAATCIAALGVTANPAGAFTTSWPAGGYVPQGPDCKMNGLIGDVGILRQSAWIDSTIPSVEDVFVNGGTSVTIPPAGRSVTFEARVIDRCSGVSLVQETLLYNESLETRPMMTAETHDVIGGMWGDARAVTPSQAGVYRMGSMVTARRYETFILDINFYLVSHTPASSGGFVVGPWSLKKMYLLRQTTLATSQSSTMIRKGRTVKFQGVLKYATDTGYLPDNGEKVTVQVKVGTGKWVTKATLTAGSTGIVTYTFVPAKTSYVRFGHTNVYSGRFTAAIVSAARKVTVS